jgi:hypothetical protein
MKKLSLLFILVILSLSVISQEYDRSPFGYKDPDIKEPTLIEFGIVLGTIVSKYRGGGTHISGQATESFSLIPGLVLGGNLDVHLNRTVRFSAGLNLGLSNATIKWTFNTGTENVLKETRPILNLPVAFDFYFLKQLNVDVGIGASADLDLTLFGKVKHYHFSSPEVTYPIENNVTHGPSGLKSIYPYHSKINVSPRITINFEKFAIRLSRSMNPYDLNVSYKMLNGYSLVKYYKRNINFVSLIIKL